MIAPPPVVFWCPGAGALRVFNKPERAGDAALRDCGKWKAHAPHSFTLPPECPLFDAVDDAPVDDAEPAPRVPTARPSSGDLGCPFCGGDRHAPDHAARCDGRQGRVEAVEDAPATVDEPARAPRVTTIHRPRETSVQAFYNAVASGVLKTRRHQAYDAIRALGNATANEVFEYLTQQGHIPIRYSGDIRPRCTELRDWGFIRELGTRACRVTKQTCIAWAVVPSSEYAGLAVVHRCAECGQVIARDVPEPEPALR